MDGPMSPFPNLHKQTASSHERKPWKRIAKLGPNNLGSPVDGVKFVRDGVLGFGLGFGRGTHTYLSFPVCLETRPFPKSLPTSGRLRNPNIWQKT
ncbi:hypothetical protein CH63R_07466 [Colletotrichum higginsianum IMI 349063]|uniref:Uncharacterized protein n=1 Tax=Colletotrichum higginsianum (strain IMI 349063) TaxID=759273 RepID=A0A1B7Y9D8_COLHI|nr:hypothetical protein CH63R_07466 [Colletotrichum higginsianum IMI 349063]OBR08701.1 hypothetical protein CH63R_07466 [Colletotrichum higginsianum IMI 349063]GJC97233.1 hypothetical protein ColKHC_06059 [Colletotrichum higginsianum]